MIFSAQNILIYSVYDNLLFSSLTNGSHINASTRLLDFVINFKLHMDTYLKGVCDAVFYTVC